jgi:hypothetical protein
LCRLVRIVGIKPPHTSVGGSEIRIRISNVFGTSPLVVSDVHVALRQSGAVTVPGSTRQLLFGGKRAVTIPTGDREFSDPVRLAVGAESDLAVSIYFNWPSPSTSSSPPGRRPGTRRPTAPTTTRRPARFLRDAIDQTDVKAIIIWEGTNDILGNPNLPLSDFATVYRQLIDVAHAHGIKVIGATLQPTEGTGGWTAEGNTLREAVNNWIPTSGAFDGTADFSTVLEDPANCAQLLPAYDKRRPPAPRRRGLPGDRRLDQPEAAHYPLQGKAPVMSR